MDPIKAGTVIGGRYRVLELIGDGSMGAVYRVESLETREILALKLLHPDLSRHPEIIARFEREAIAASRIDHPNVVHATDFGCSADGSFFLILELVEGRDLRAVLSEGPMDAARAINVMRGVVAGVRAAHEKGVVHRDLKPENIMLVEREGNRDFVKLLDFGIARLEAANPQSGMQALTVAGQPLGTPEYMSPEQVLGQKVDARSDLYSLGVIFFELLTGACPFDGHIPKLLQQHLTAEPPELPPAVVAQNRQLARIVRMLLAKAPKNRFQTAAELSEALIASTTAPAAKAGSPPTPSPESRTLASLAVRASLAKKRLVGMVAPPARGHRGFGWWGVLAAVLAVAVLLVILFVAVTRDCNGPVQSTVPEPSATSRAESNRVESPAPPSASGGAAKETVSKPRRKASEGTPLPKGKSK